jgi:hypothetical protein
LERKFVVVCGGNILDYAKSKEEAENKARVHIQKYPLTNVYVGVFLCRVSNKIEVETF